MKLQIKFPCGYEINFKTCIWDYLTGIEIPSPKLCPIHGKNYSQTINKAKSEVRE
jgi:hypothetical protein